jgi:parallel beta-helix repeat protein
MNDRRVFLSLLCLTAFGFVAAPTVQPSADSLHLRLVILEGHGDARPDASTDTVHVSPPTGERESDRASVLAALEQVRAGGTVMFGPGTYLVGGLIEVSVPRVTLLGHPQGTTLRGCLPADLLEGGKADGRCNGLELSRGHQTVRNLTFEHMSWAALRIRGALHPGGQRRATTAEGGHLIEGNTFRNSDSFDVWSESSEPIVIRNNRFINTYHAISMVGTSVHFLDNEISAPEPDKIPFGQSNIAIGLAQFSSTADPPCADNVIAGNRIEGHPDGIHIGVLQPRTSCRRNVIRDNTIVVRRIRLTAAVRNRLGSGADSTYAGVPLRLANFSQAHPEMFGGAAPAGQEAVLGDNVIERNRVIGAEGLGIEILHAARNRIVNNTITGVVRRHPFPGTFLLDPPNWREGNGAAIWISPGSSENELVGNTFTDIAGHAVVIEGNRNHVAIRSASDVVRDLGTGNRVTRPR